MKAKATKSAFLLFLAAAIWGMAFVFQTKGMEDMGPLTFNGVRCLIGAVTLLFYLLITRRGKKRQSMNLKAAIIGGICCGVMLTMASSLQQIGLQYTTVGKAGFITTLYIIFVPIFGLLLRRKVPGIVWIGALLAAVGLYLLCMTESFRFSIGDLLVLVCAVIFAIHIMLVDHFAPNTDGVAMSCVQFTVCGFICTTAALFLEQPSFTQISGGMISLLYAGVMSCGVAYTLQIVGQANMNPTIAALIMSLESVIATICGFAAYKLGFLQEDQSMTAKQIIGCVLVFSAVILVQLPRKNDSQVIQNET